jgi:hypothetical protein
MDYSDNIEMYRGDTYTATIEITDTDGDPYVLQEGDQLIFAVKKFFDDLIFAIEPKQLDGLTLTISADETKNLPFGNYYYNIKLINEDLGTVRTVVGPAILKIMQEVPIDA